MEYLNTSVPSLIIFSIQMFFLMSVFAMISRPSFLSFSFLTLTWLIGQSSWIVYGIVTGQIGFILLGSLTIFLTIISLIMRIGSVDDNK